MKFYLLSEYDLNVLATQFGYYKRLIPFCSCPPSPSPRSEAPKLANPSRAGQSPFAGVPRAQWQSARKTRPSNA